MFIVDLIRILSVLLAIVGTTFLIPVGVALYCGETNVLLPFLVPMLISWILCLVITLLFKKRKITLNIRKTYRHIQRYKNLTKKLKNHLIFT